MNPPPFLVSFAATEQLLGALPDEVRNLYGAPFEALAPRGLPPVVSIRCLATLFGYSSKFTGAMYRRSERYYRAFSIPTGKKQRTIHAPKGALKVIQKWFGFYLAETFKCGDCVYGFVKGRSAVEAASSHCGADWVYSLDIADFFPSTPLIKVKEALKEPGYPDHGAELVAMLCCYNGTLAQGSPASPVLSNLVFCHADAELEAVAKHFKVDFTRYADDIVFSGTGEFPAELKSEIRTIIESNGWTIATQKERLAKRPNRLKVHGLLVNGPVPRLTKGYRNRIGAFGHLLDTDRVGPGDVERLRGHLSYAHSVEHYH
ncbi:MAG: reverse transcriptase family protein [Verrucomicrobiota bacterium]